MLTNCQPGGESGGETEPDGLETTMAREVERRLNPAGGKALIWH
jgi:hypothetical protein